MISKQCPICFRVSPADRELSSVRSSSRVAIPADVEERLLCALTELGQVTYAANVSGMARRSLYNRRCRDADFAAGWDDTREAFEETLTPRAIGTALHMGTGHWVSGPGPDRC